MLFLVPNLAFNPAYHKVQIAIDMKVTLNARLTVEHSIASTAIKAPKMLTVRK